MNPFTPSNELPYPDGESPLPARLADTEADKPIDNEVAGVLDDKKHARAAPQAWLKMVSALTAASVLGGDAGGANADNNGAGLRPAENGQEWLAESTT